MIAQIFIQIIVIILVNIKSYIFQWNMSQISFIFSLEKFYVILSYLHYDIGYSFFRVSIS